MFFLRVWYSLYSIKNECLPNYKVKSAEKRNNNVVEQDTTIAEHEMILESLCLLLFRKKYSNKRHTKVFKMENVFCKCIHVQGLTRSCNAKRHRHMRVARHTPVRPK